MRLFPALFFFLIIGSSIAQEVDVNSSIQDVKIYQSGAQVSREAQVKLKQGRNVFVLDQITPNLNASSISVQGNEAFTILSAKYRYNNLQGLKKSGPVREKEDSLAYAKMKMGLIQSEISGYREESDLIRANRSIKGSNAILLPEDLEEMGDYVRLRTEQILIKIYDLERKSEKIAATINNLERSLSILKNRQGQRSGEIVIELEANSAANVNLRCSYVVYGASWRPSYDVRVQEVGEPVKLSYHAVVSNATGVDWENVDVTISTGNPFQGNALPELYKWYFEDGSQSAGGYRNVELEQKSRSQALGDEMMATNQMPEVQVQQSLVSTEFVLERKYNILSNNEETRLEMKKYSVPAKYDYLAVSRLDKQGYLRAQITDWRSLNLIPGQSNIYYQKTYVGQDFINSQQTDDTLSISLGRDPGLALKRERVQEDCKSILFGNKKRSSSSYRITMRNNKSKTITVVLKDQIPLSNSENVEITVKELSGGVLEPETGFVTWTVELAPGQSIEKILSYEAKHPKNVGVPRYF